MQRKTSSAVLIVLLLVLTIYPCHAGSILPDLKDAYGVAMPSLAAMLGRYPDGIEYGPNGETVETFNGITEVNYNAFGALLSSEGCEMKDYTFENGVLKATVAREGRTFLFEYETAKGTVRLTYRQDAYDEVVDQAESRYREAAALTAEGLYWEAYSVYQTILGYRDVDSLLKKDDDLLAAAEAEKAVRDTMYSVGSHVTFGHYPQTGEGNDNTPIEWVILARDGQKALLLSRYSLDAKPYNKEYVAITWENSTIRTWLNEEFLKKAFTTQEQAGIVLTKVDNSASQGVSKWSRNGGNNTEDRVFLLSYAEAKQYFGVTSDSDNTKARVAPTAYAKKQGASTSSNNKTAEGEAAGFWWLRSPGIYQSYAAYVFTDGSLHSSFVSGDFGCVRPALWIDVDKVGILMNSEVSQYLTRALEGQTAYGDKSNHEKSSHGQENDAAYLKPFKMVGNYVAFGHYPQTESGTDVTPIEWLVLDYDKQNNQALLLSRFGLDAQPYNNSWDDVTWQQSALRKWLNSEFISKAFSAGEQQAIVKTYVDNSEKQGFDFTTVYDWADKTRGESSTEDKVFLLSYAEANSYLGVMYDDGNNTKSRVSPTRYAIKQGATANNEYLTADGAPSGGWWLRSPASGESLAAFVSYNGSFSEGFSIAGDACVRPAVWVDLDSEFFSSLIQEDV